MLKNCLLSRNEQDTNHKVYIWQITFFLVSIILLCLAISSLKLGLPNTAHRVRNVSIARRILKSYSQLISILTYEEQVMEALKEHCRSQIFCNLYHKCMCTYLGYNNVPSGPTYLYQKLIFLHPSQYKCCI